MNTLIKILLLLILTSNVLMANEKNLDPIFFLENIIKECKPLIKEKKNEILEKKISEFTDFNEISLWVVGKSEWENTPKIKKDLFIVELKKIILKTYNRTIINYIDSEIEFYLQNDKEINFLKRIQVSSKIKKNDKIINVNYRLIKIENSWFIFDIIIEGVSILRSLKAQFSEMIKTIGLENTTEKMKSLNKKQ